MALDSSRQTQSITIFDSGSGTELISELQENRSSSLMPMLVSAFEKLKLKPADIDLVVLSTGPGSFTGIRTAVTIVKTLAAELELPVFAVNNFELKRFELGDFDRAVVLPAGKNDYFISLDRNYANLETNYFSLEPGDYEIGDFNQANLSKLLVEFFISLDSPQTLAYNEVSPYYLREPSIGKIQKRRVSSGA